MAQIKIRTVNSIIEFESVIDFSPIDLPYMCFLGYRKNCTSSADTNELNKYWNFIDDFFSANNIPTNDYVTLETIIHNDVRYGL